MKLLNNPNRKANGYIMATRFYLRLSNFARKIAPGSKFEKMMNTCWEHCVYGAIDNLRIIVRNIENEF